MSIVIYSSNRRVAEVLGAHSLQGMHGLCQRVGDIHGLHDTAPASGISTHETGRACPLQGNAPKAAERRSGWVAHEGLCISRHLVHPVHRWVERNSLLGRERDSPGIIPAGQRVQYMTMERQKH